MTAFVPGLELNRQFFAEIIRPLLAATLSAATLKEREQSLAASYETVAQIQNALALVEPQDAAPRPYHWRPYRVIHAERFAQALASAIHDEELQRIIHDVGLVGAVDQFVDSTDVVSHARRSQRLGDFYGV